MDMRDWIAAVLRTPEERLAELEQRIREQPEAMAKEGQRRAALRYFLRCYREMRPKFLEELRAVPPVPDTALFLWDLAARHHLPWTIVVANEFMRTLLMWQAFPDVPNLWHFEVAEGEWANPLRPAAPLRPYPFHFKADGWNPETETLKGAKTRLREQFQAALEEQSRFWQVTETARSELRRFEESTSLTTLRRNLKCLAEKQANPQFSQQKLADRFGVTRHALRLGLFEAADLIGLPREEVRNARAGAPLGCHTGGGNR